ncbi:hypothetical protein PCANB_002285 [Pneumocystis canis]|nr:hypothetical protein PCANB_002285 [Pneumocystis canis]
MKKSIKNLESNNFCENQWISSSSISSPSFSTISELDNFSEEILFVGKRFQESKMIQNASKNEYKPSGNIKNENFENYFNEDDIFLNTCFYQKSSQNTQKTNTLDINKSKKQYKNKNENFYYIQDLNYNDTLKKYHSDSTFLNNINTMTSNDENLLETFKSNLYNHSESSVNIISKSNCQALENNNRASIFHLNKKFKENFNLKDENDHSFHSLNNLKSLKNIGKKKRQRLYEKEWIEQNLKTQESKNKNPLNSKETIRAKKTLRELLLQVNNVICQFISDYDLMEYIKLVDGVFTKAYGITSKSYGFEKSRHIILYKTTKIHNNYSKQCVDKILRSFNHKQHNLGVFQTKKSDKSENNYSRIHRNKNKNKNKNRYHDGDIVGKNVPEIDKNNRGRIMLEKLGWVSGNGLGASDNKGIEVPIMAVIKTTKSGLR